MNLGIKFSSAEGLAPYKCPGWVLNIVPSENLVDLIIEIKSIFYNRIITYLSIYLCNGIIEYIMTCKLHVLIYKEKSQNKLGNNGIIYLTCTCAFTL